MAREIPDLQAVVRTGTGKGAARQARRAGDVPGIIYGAGKEPVAISMNFNYLLKRLKQGRFLQSLFNIKVEGQDDVKVVCRSVQRDVVKDLPTHIDFMRVSDDTPINLFINVEFINADKAPGLKRGGSLDVALNEIELVVLASAIPDSVIVDLEGKNIGDVLTTADLALPEGASVPAGRVIELANIAAPTGLAASSEE